MRAPRRSQIYQGQKMQNDSLQQTTGKLFINSRRRHDFIGGVVAAFSYLGRPITDGNGKANADRPEINNL